MRMLTVAEAAKRLNVTRERVYALIKGKRLPATRFGNAWQIDEQHLKFVKDRKPGRPPKPKP